MYIVIIIEIFVLDYFGGSHLGIFKLAAYNVLEIKLNEFVYPKTLLLDTKIAFLL